MALKTYEPFTARQCPICEAWVDGIDGEDYNHTVEFHPEKLAREGEFSIGLPFFRWNEEAITVEVQS